MSLSFYRLNPDFGGRQTTGLVFRRPPRSILVMKSKRSIAAQNEARIARALKPIALHEAGHAYVAMELGSPDAIIKINPRRWHPKTEVLQFRGRCGHSPMKSKLHEAATAFAGAVAEVVVRNPSIQIEDCARKIPPKLSRSDLKKINSVHPAWRSRALELAWRLVRKNRKSIKWAARALEHARRPIRLTKQNAFGPKRPVAL
jgi:hypothetical protein